MNKRFISYVDMYKNKITSLVLAEFDVDILDDEDRETLDEWENGESSEVAEEILDSLKPYYYYYAVDFNEAEPFIIVSGEDPSGERWPVQCNNIYKKFHKAEQVLKSGLVDNNINRGIIRNILKHN